MINDHIGQIPDEEELETLRWFNGKKYHRDSMKDSQKIAHPQVKQRRNGAQPMQSALSKGYGEVCPIKQNRKIGSEGDG